MGKSVVDTYNGTIQMYLEYPSMLDAVIEIRDKFSKTNDFKCPICKGIIYVETFSKNNKSLMYFESTKELNLNTLYHCALHDDHTFWRNENETPEFFILHLNKNANHNTSKSEQDFIYIPSKINSYHSGIWKPYKQKSFLIAGRNLKEND